MNILGIDIGTTSLSFVILDVMDRKLIKSLTIKNDFAIPSSNTYQRLQDADKIWLAVQQVLNMWDPEQEMVQGIGLTGQMHGIVYVDSRGAAVSPLYTWQDGSGAQIGPDGISYADRLSDLTGMPAATGFGAVTYFTHQMLGQVPAATVSFCTIMDYIGMKLTGRKASLIDASNAASCGLFDLNFLCFDQAAIKKAGLSPDVFPQVTSQRRILGYWHDRIPVVAAIGDNQASFLGAVIDQEQSILVNVGTGSQISFMTPSASAIPGMELRPFIDGNYLLVHSPLCGGRAYALLADFYQQIMEAFAGYSGISCAVSQDMVYGWMNELLDKYSSRIQEDTDRVKIDPSFCGTRADQAIRGSITGIGISGLTPEMLTYGMLEGIVRDLYEAFDRCSPQCKSQKSRLVGSGNGIRKNPHLQKIFGRTFRLPFELAENKEEAACGAAIYAGGAIAAAKGNAEKLR